MRRRSAHSKRRLRVRMSRIAEAACIAFIAFSIPAFTLSNEMSGVRETSALFALVSLITCAASFGALLAIRLIARGRRRRERAAATKRESLGTWVRY